MEILAISQPSLLTIGKLTFYLTRICLDIRGWEDDRNRQGADWHNTGI